MNMRHLKNRKNIPILILVRTAPFNKHRYFGRLAAEIGPVVWEPQLISTGFASWQLYCRVLQQWASAKLCGVEERAPPIFGTAAITLVVGPHSSLSCTYNSVDF